METFATWMSRLSSSFRGACHIALPSVAYIFAGAVRTRAANYPVLRATIAHVQFFVTWREKPGIKCRNVGKWTSAEDLKISICGPRTLELSSANRLPSEGRPTMCLSVGRDTLVMRLS